MLGFFDFHCTGKSLSEVLIFASFNPPFHNRLSHELQIQYEKNMSSVHVVLLYINCSEKSICVNNMYRTCSFLVLNS